jgi:protocatechuate 3,4-dioxygenase beta subunit
MKRIFQAAILIALASARLFAQTSDNSQPQASISGTVLDSVTQQPIPGATVSLRNRGARSVNNPSATTNAEGEFILQGIAPGRYTLSAAHDGYVNQRGTGSGLSRQSISVSSGDRLTNLKFRLAPGAVISGVVTDAAGKPLRNAAVEAMKRSYRQGQAELNSVTSVSTNARGEYRIENLPRGDYYLRVSHAGSLEVKPKESEVYAPLYYPSATDVEHSVALSMREGEQLSAIEIHLVPVRAFRVKGVALNGSTSLPAKGAHVVLVGDQGKQTFSPKEPSPGSTGVFDFHGIPSGSYLLAADLPPTGAGKTLYGRVSVQVSALNVSNVEVVLNPGAEINGRLRADARDNLDLSRLVVELEPRDPLTATAAPDTPSTAVSADGSFVFHDIPDGAYSLNILGVPPGFYLSANSADVFESGIEVARGAAPAAPDITLAPAKGRVDGAVSSRDGTPLSGITVLLVPNGSRRSQFSAYRRAVTDPSGRFALQTIPPGDYQLFASSDMQINDFMSLDPSAPLEQGKAIHIDNETTLTVQLEETPDR